VREFEVIEHAESALGTLILRRRTAPVPDVIELTLDHQFLMSSAVTVSERELATRAIAMHGGSDLDVLIGGLGLGYTSKAALDSDRVARVEVVELVQGIIDWVASGVIPLGKELMADARFHATRDDVFERLRRPATTTHDVLLIDVDHSPDERLGGSSDSFYAHANLCSACGRRRRIPRSKQSSARRSTTSTSSRSSSSTRRSASQKRTGSSSREAQLPADRLFLTPCAPVEAEFRLRVGRCARRLALEPDDARPLERARQLVDGLGEQQSRSCGAAITRTPPPPSDKPAC